MTNSGYVFFNSIYLYFFNNIAYSATNSGNIENVWGIVSINVNKNDAEAIYGIDFKIHNPKEFITEVKEIKEKNFIPVHNSKFKLALHPWYEPLELIVTYANEENLPITTPMIGEKVDLNNLNHTWEKWWQKFM